VLVIAEIQLSLTKGHLPLYRLPPVARIIVIGVFFGARAGPRTLHIACRVTGARCMGSGLMWG